MPNHYIIAGCNGTGKTTVSYSVLPETLECRTFVAGDTHIKTITLWNQKIFDSLREKILKRLQISFEKLVREKAKDNQIIVHEKYDAKRTYKKITGYFPGIAML